MADTEDVPPPAHTPEKETGGYMSPACLHLTVRVPVVIPERDSSILLVGSGCQHVKAVRGHCVV